MQEEIMIVTNITPDELYDYINFHLENANYNYDQQQIIRLIFTLAYKDYTKEGIIESKHLEHIYKPYSTIKMLELCDSFIQSKLNMDMDLFDLIHILKRKIEQKIPLL